MKVVRCCVQYSIAPVPYEAEANETWGGGEVELRFLKPSLGVTEIEQT